MGEFRQEIVQKNKPLRKGSSSRGKRGQSLGVYDTGTDVSRCHLSWRATLAQVSPEISSLGRPVGHEETLSPV